MVIMRVPVVESLYQTAIGRFPVLKYLLLGASGCLLPRLVVTGFKYHRFPMTRLHWCLADAESPRAWLSGARVCHEPGR
jgi:hypothetical protein